jgi:hypothetical protein
MIQKKNILKNKTIYFVKEELKERYVVFTFLDSIYLEVGTISKNSDDIYMFGMPKVSAPTLDTIDLEDIMNFMKSLGENK